MDVDRIWQKSYQPGVDHTIDPNTIPSLVDLFEQDVQRFADAPAYSNFGTVLSYNQMDTITQQFASFLQNQLHMVKGERLAIMLPNTLQYPIAFFGALRAGLTVVNVNPLYTATELEHQLKDAGATAIVVMENFAHTLETALPKTDIQHVIVTQLGDLLGLVKGPLINFAVRYIRKLVPKWQIKNSYRWNTVISQGSKLPFKRISMVNDDIALLQYTGGTTGVSKGAVLTHRNLMANLMQAAAWLKPLNLSNTSGGIITALPLYHIFSLTANCLMFFHLGIENILITNPRDLPGMIRELRRRPFCAFTGVNTLFNGLLHTRGFENLNFSNLKLTLGGGMAVQKAVATRWKKVTGTAILEAYGLTECSPAVTISPFYQSDYTGSIGLPLPSTDILILDEFDKPLPVGSAGELCVRGPQVMQGYWKKPEETAKVFKNGWLHTGDIATIDDDGFVFIVDRKKDMIKVSGFNVYPNEVEDVIALQEGVKEVAVIGIPGSTGEVVKAYVVSTDPNLTPETILAHCRQHLTGYKMPKEIEFRQELPKSNVGKVLRKVLKEEALAGKQG